MVTFTCCIVVQKRHHHQIFLLFFLFDFWDRSGRVTFHNPLFSLSHSVSINFKDEFSYTHSRSIPFYILHLISTWPLYQMIVTPTLNLIFHHKTRVYVCERKYHCPFIYTHYRPYEQICNHISFIVIYMCVCSLTAYATQNKTHRLSNKNQKSYNHTLSHRSHLIWAIDPISITTNVILYAFSSLIFICIQTLTHSHTCIDI